MSLIPGPLQIYFGFKKWGYFRAGFKKSIWMNPCGTLHYWRGGNRQSPIKILLIHGLGGSTLQDYADLPPHLCKKYEVLSIDLPGFGLSCDVDFPQSIEKHVAIIREFLLFQKIDHPIIIGNSMGGWVTLSFCLKYPQIAEKIVLLAPAGIEFEPPPPEIFLPEGPQDMDRLLAYLIYHPPKLNDWFRRDWYKVMARHRPAIQSMIEKMLSRTEVLTGEQISGIKQPALIIFGLADRIIPSSTGEHLHEYLPGSRLKIYPECGHLVQANCFASVLEEIESFIGSTDHLRRS